MNYCIVNNENMIENIIVCASDETAKQFGAVPSYDGAKIGDEYNPPEPVTPEVTVEERVTALEDAITKGLSL